MELCQKKKNTVSLFLSENKACGIVLNTLKSVDRGFIYTKEKGIAVVNARHDETKNEFGSCFSRYMFSDQADAAR